MKGKLLVVLITVLLLSIAFSGCFEDASKKETGTGEVIYNNLTIEELDFTVESYPKVDGSTSAHPLAVLIACKILNVNYSWSDVNWFFPGGIVKRRLSPDWMVGKQYIASYIDEYVVHHGTHDAYVNLINKTADVILVARSPSPDEISLAKNQSVELVVKPVALDAFVFLLHENNSINSLSIKQIQDIYTGIIVNWSDVGGNTSDIHAYQRERNSGSQELMDSLVIGDLEMIDAPEMILYGMMGPINRLDSDVNGIGYSVYFFKEFMTYGANIKTCAINGIIPNYENISTKTYPLTAEVYVVIRTDLETTGNAYKLRDWLLGENGQSIVQESGYVPMTE